MSRVPNSLRAGPNGIGGGYTNGYHDDNGSHTYDQNGNDGVFRNTYDGGRDQPRRLGAYGGFDFSQDDEDSEGPHVGRPADLERQRANRRSGDRRWNEGRSRSRPDAGRYGEGSRQIEEVLRHIGQEWDFMSDEKCVPVQVALQLMDPSSLGLARRYDQFQDTHRQLQGALKTIVNEHYQGFNSSIGTFHKIQSSIQASQSRVRTLRNSLVQAKLDLSTSKPELKGFATTSQNYDDILQVLTAIEHLQVVPEKLEAQISEKRFLSAVDTLQEALRSIRKSEMENIGALGDLKVYLSNQEHSLTEILIEELHNHLYLKSPYCEDRWKPYSQHHLRDASLQATTTSLESRGKLYEFLSALDTSVTMVEDTSRNPEADTFHYIQLLLEALSKMDRLDVAVNAVEHRLPVELFRIVDRCNNEVDQRHPSTIRGAKDRRAKSDPTTGNSARTAVLKDLLWTLYARFEAIAEGHRVMHDVVLGITRRDGLRDVYALTKGFKELWNLYQSEIRSLLHDYLATDADLAHRTGQGSAGGSSVFNRTQRDKNKNIFKLSNMDNKSTELISEREDLEFILKSSVPGLVSDSKRLTAISPTTTSTTHEASGTGHKLLVEPSVFNMGILLPPSLIFLNRLREVVPPAADIATTTLTAFLDEFLANVFVPQLDETLAELCAQTMIESDAFQQDPRWASHAQKPVFKGTVKFFELVRAVCAMLDNLPHDQAFSQLIITQMASYYDRCYGWYKALVIRPQVATSPGTRLKFSAFLAERSDVRDVVTALTENNDENVQDVLEKEASLLITNEDSKILEELDLILDRKNITAVCLLCTSMRWIASKIGQLRRISDHATDSSPRQSGRHQQRRRWTNINLSEQTDDEAFAFLPLSVETARAFDGVVESFNELAETALRTLHLEVRSHILFHVKRLLRGNYLLDQLFDDPDNEVRALDAELVNMEEEFSTYLQPSQQTFITNGLGLFTDQLIVTDSSYIKAMNENGCGRMQLNILVLQQNLKNLEPKAQLSRSALYFDLFSAGPDAILEKAKESGGEDLGYTYDELKVLMELCYSEALESERREATVQARRVLEDHLRQLSEHS